MQKMSLDAIAHQQLTDARKAHAGRSATTVFGGHEHALRQTVIALLAGSALGDHENPGEATIYVISGRVEISAGSDVWQGRSGDLLIVPDTTHGLRALEDSVVLLTAVPRAFVGRSE
jgi:quercetin dioxygenase-like cupin family protein